MTERGNVSRTAMEQRKRFGGVGEGNRPLTRRIEGSEKVNEKREYR